MKKRRKPLTIVLALAVALGVGVSLSACSDGGSSSADSGQQADNATRQSNYDKLVKSQPAHTMDYSPTRATKNFWIDTWSTPGKLSYVYLMDSTGNVIGYYVFKGLPVSYCTSLVPPYQVKTYYNGDGGDNPLAVSAPSVDGTYSSSANCSTMYGEDATTGTYIEYTVGLGINALVYSEPMPLQNQDKARPLGPTTLDQAKAIDVQPSTSASSGSSSSTSSSGSGN
ncbi:MAG: hypothetical protein LBM73_00800 [Candidatus Nomurabacteria bacterium]|nr:hypothetical protein [Candidatus Nomurabacteria bacterium]